MQDNPSPTLPESGNETKAAPTGRGILTGADLGGLDSLLLPFAADPFYRLRPPLSQEAMALSLELASMAYHLNLEDWLAAGWRDVSIQIDNTLQSGVTQGESASGEQLRALLNSWKLHRAKSALKERNPFSQIAGAFRQRERSDTIKAVTMLRRQKGGTYVVAIGFMGTGTRFYDWFSNLRFSTEEGFHKGFSQLAAYFEESAERIFFPSTAAELGLERLTLADILVEMKSLKSRFRLWMAGHSQGGAVMQIFCHRLIYDWGALPQNIVGYGFASPTVSTGRFVHDPARYPLYHILNSDDLVPRVGALLHLGLCLQYQAGSAFRDAAYDWSEEESHSAVRDALKPFTHQMTDTLSVMETSVAFCYCLLEEKGEENLNLLIDKKWTVAPIEKALAYAGDKAQDMVRAIARYTESGYVSLTGREMDEKRIAAIKESMRPVVKKFTLRQLLGGLHDLSVPPHRLTREPLGLTGAYGYITQRGWRALKPFIWLNEKDSLPAKRFAEEAYWHEDAPGSGYFRATQMRRHSHAKPRHCQKTRGRTLGVLRQKKAGAKTRPRSTKEVGQP